MLWLKRFLQELDLKQDGYIVNCDSQSTIDVSKNSMYHSHSKHIEVRYNWLRLVIEQQWFELEKIHTDENLADMLTKVVSREKLKLCAGLAGMNSDWRLELKISSVVGWRGRLLGAKHCVGPAHALSKLIYELGSKSLQIQLSI